MSLQVEKLEKNMAKLTVEVPADQFAKAITTAFNKKKSKFNIPGFRKGKAPLIMVEKIYGVEVLYEDAANDVIDATYGDAVKESGLDVTSRPDIELVQVEKGKEFIYTAMVAVKPEVTLGAYKGIEVEKASSEVTDEDVDSELKRIQDQNARLITVEDRAIEDGDQAVIDFIGSVEGTPFEGGEGKDYSLTIGSHSFIDTFEEQLIGRKNGDECEVSVTFPEEYQAKDLAGKQALFKVAIKEIKRKELPELNDEFAEEVSEFDTLEEYKNHIRETLTLKKEKDAAAENENRVVDKVVENASMEIPEPMIEGQTNMMLDESSRGMQNQGISLQQYLSFTGMTVEALKEEMRPQAIKRLETRLALEAVVDAENIKISDEAVEEEISKIADSYKTEALKIKESLGESGIERIRADLAVQEAINFLVAEAKLV